MNFCGQEIHESEVVAFCGKRLKGKVLYLVMKVMEVWLGFSGEICRGKPGQSTSGFSLTCFVLIIRPVPTVVGLARYIRDYPPIKSGFRENG